MGWCNHRFPLPNQCGEKLINLADHIGSLVNAVIVALIGAVVALIRKVFTSEKKIEILETKLQSVNRIEKEVDEIKQDIKAILFKLTEHNR